MGQAYALTFFLSSSGILTKSYFLYLVLSRVYLADRLLFRLERGRGEG